MFAFDTTPAENRVDGRMIDRGDMVNVILRALEIHLGHGGSRDDNYDYGGGNGDDDKQRRRQGGGGGGGYPLSGAHTSAAMMASDFILDKLEHIAEEYPGNARAPVLYRVAGDGGGGRSGVGGYAAAYGFDVDDYNNKEVRVLSFGSGWELEDAEMSVLFGMGEIKVYSDNH